MSRIGEQLLPAEAFDGRTYDPVKDHKRLTGQLNRVYACMMYGNWMTLAEIASFANGTEASVSARLRDLRKKSYGSRIIDRRRVGSSGLFQYRLVP